MKQIKHMSGRKGTILNAFAYDAKGNVTAWEVMTDYAIEVWTIKEII